MSKTQKLQSKQISICFSESLYDALQKLSAKKKISLAAVVRECVEKGTMVDYYAAEQDMIRGFIREEIEVVLNKNIDRIIRLQLKGTQAAATMMYACIRVLSDVYADEVTFENVLARAHKEAHVYMKQKEQPFEYHLTEARKLIEGANNTTTFNDM
jgi:predicted DNA-binding protein